MMKINNFHRRFFVFRACAICLCIGFGALCSIPFPTPIAAAADSAPLKKEDFAYGIPLRPMAKGAVCRLDLPLDIYLTSTRPDLKDIRIFNSRGEAVPHLIRKKEQKRPAENISTTLTFFPVHMEGEKKGDPLSMQITTNDAGAIVSVHSGISDNSRKTANAYIIDATGLDAPSVQQLEINWTSAAPSFYVEASIFASHDLNHWQKLVGSAPLVRLMHGGHELTRHTISLPINTYRYFRLEWPKAPEDARITSIKAIQTGGISEETRHRREVSGRRASNNQEVFEFDTGGFFPVEYVQALPAEPNSLIQGMLESRPDKKANWRQRGVATFYDLRLGQTPLVNDPVKVPLSRDRYWRLTVQNRDGGIGDEPPRLEIQWSPRELLFLARGNGEFTLAMGNARPEPGKAPQSPFMQILKQTHQTGVPFAGVTTGEKMTLGGPAALEPPKPPFPWKQVILWGVLVVGVGVVGWMAWQLVVQMKAGEGEQDEK